MKILLADDHALIRTGLRGELGELDADVAFVEAWDADSLRRMFDSHPDLSLALVDLTMPGMDGARTIAALQRDHAAVPLIVLSASDTGAEVEAVLHAGAAGFIPKSAPAKVMIQAIRLVLAGGRYLPPQLMERLGRRDARIAQDQAVVPARANLKPEASPASRHDALRLKLLSPRQQEVFVLLERGLSNKMIARELDVTEGTVKSHVATIFDVLNVHNRVSAIAEARLLAGKESFERPGEN